MTKDSFSPVLVEPVSKITLLLLHNFHLFIICNAKRESFTSPPIYCGGSDDVDVDDDDDHDYCLLAVLLSSRSIPAQAEDCSTKIHIKQMMFV